MTDAPSIENVMVTGATGFVGRHVVRELLAHGYKPVCVVRAPERLMAQHADVSPERLTAVVGSLGHRDALQHAADLSQAAIHLVGIIIERKLKGQTFRRVHVQGTHNVLDAVSAAGIHRYVHMSALGTRNEAVSKYHKTKWESECLVRDSELDWTVFRPSLIHGPDGEFMQLMKSFVCDVIPPVIPYFGTGQSKLQPVSVKDVARCFVRSLRVPESVRQIVPMGGPKTYTWLALYNACRARIPGAKRWKPLVGQSVSVARVAALASAPPLALAELIVPSFGKFRFDAGQIQMSQENSVCDHTMAESMFGIKMRDFEAELSDYAQDIGS